MIPTEERIPSVYSIPLVLFFIAVLLFMGLLQRHWDLSLMGLLVLSVFGGAYGWSKVSTYKLSCGMHVDRQRLFPGESVAVSVWVENAKPLPIWIRVQVATDRTADTFTVREAFDGRCGLLWYQKTRFTWQADVLRRGVHTLGPSYVTTADMFGFFPRHRQDQSIEIIVYPRIVPLRPIDLPRRSMFGVPGTKSPVQDPVYILGTRDYQAGRPARVIHWKASARHNRLQEKIFDPSEQEKVLLALDVGGFAAHEAGDLWEKAIEATASLGAAMERKSNAFGFATNAKMVGEKNSLLPIAGHRRQLPDLLELLARMKMTCRTDLGTLLSKGMSLSWGASALIFTYNIDSSSRSLAGYFSGRKIPVRFVVCRPDNDADVPITAGLPHFLLKHVLFGDGGGP